MNEIWKQIDGFINYDVSTHGRVRNSNTGKVLKPQSGGRYLHVQLRNDGKSKSIKIHKLVAMSFLDHTPDKLNKVIDHINNNRTDNRLENLQIVSHRHNCTKDLKGFSSNYIGVSWFKNAKKWIAQISINGKKNYIGSYDKEIDAHLAYQNKLTV